MFRLSGIDFLALQVRDLEKSAQFYEEVLGFKRAKFSPEHAVVFDTRPFPFALRDPLVDLDSVPQLGHGVAMWFLTEDSAGLLEQLQAADVPIVQGLTPSPFGQTLMFRDPDGYVITVHDKAG